MKKALQIVVICIIAYILLFLAGQSAFYEKCPYRYLVLTPEDEYLIAQCVEAECGTGYTTYECKIATTQVILNRIMSDRFADDAQVIIRDSSQFSTYPALLGCEPTDETWNCLQNTLMGIELVIDYDVLFFAQGLNPGTQFVARIGGHTFSK